MKTKSTFYLTPFKHFTFGKDKQALVCSRLIGVVIAALVLLTASVNVQAQRKYHVSTSGNNLHSGLTWRNAFATLEKAISAATSNSDTIFVQEGTYYQSAAYTLITNDIKIFGSFNGTETRLEQRIFSNKNLTILDAQNKSCVINLSGRSSATVIDGFMITNGKHDDNYGGGGMDLYNSSPALRNLIIINNSAVHGGGITNFYSSPKLTNVIIEGNTANFFGGGMYNNSSSPTLTDVTFDRNTANNSGGGMYNHNSAPTLTDVTIRRNIIYINGDGGGMYNNNSAPTLTNVTISENTATDNCAGGGMFNNNSSPMLTNVTISGNIGSGGGGMYNINSSSPSLTNVAISGNTARSGGGMKNNNSSPKLKKVTIIGNVVSTAGGGMYNITSSPTLTNVTISGNTADWGGGMENTNSSPKLTNVIIDGNMAKTNGGGMFNNSSSPTLTDVTFDKNKANNSGGGMYNHNSAPTLTDVTIRRNIIYINGDGGGMHNNNSAPTLTNVTISENTAMDDCSGGGMYNNNSSPMMTNVTISGNRGSGGGGMNNNNSSSPTLINMIIIGNMARSGGGMNNNNNSSPKLINVSINGNVVSTGGGGMNNVTSSPTLTNVTISGNTAGFGGGMENRFNSRPQLYNSIVLGNNIANNISDDIVNYSVNDIPKYDFCLVGGKGYGYHNGTSWDNKLYNAKDIFVYYHPSFAGAPTTLGDYSLLSKSFAIDKGYNKYNIVPTDLAGNPRIVNGTIDLGAYEYQRAFSKSATLGAQSGSLTTKESSIFTATPTGTANISANELKVYPNPFIDEVHITGTYGKTTLRIFNSNGAVVHTQRITSPNETLSLGSLPSGMYFFRLENDGKAITVKAIKLR